MNHATLVSISGPIAAGKTTLTQQLATLLDAQIRCENFAANPYLEQFYIDPPKHALQTQLHFLADRFEQLRLDFWPRQGIILTDYIFEQDQLFAELTLDQQQMAQYYQATQQLHGKIKLADVVVYLSANPNVLLARIRDRGRDMEQHIVQDYVERLAAAYDHLMEEYDAAPVIVVNSETTDIRQHAAVKRIAEQIKPHLATHARI